MKPILYMLCGIPSSGKSTWAVRFFAKDGAKMYVSRDSIRFSIIKEDEDYFSHEKEVFSKFANIIAVSLAGGQDVIADATHINKASRRKLINAIDMRVKDYQIIYIVFKTPVETCLACNKNREGRAVVPDETIIKMANNFEYPQKTEDTRAIETWYVERMNENE